MIINCIGDSLTQGYGVPVKDRWTNLLSQRKLVKIINKGVNGNTTADMLERFYVDVIESRPTHVIIMGGTNDMLLDYPVRITIDNITLLIKEAIEYSIIPIIAIQIPCDVKMAEKFWTESTVYNKVNILLQEYRDFCINFTKQNNLQYIDFYKLYESLSSKYTSKELYLDGIHPTALGHSLMSNYIQI